MGKYLLGIDNGNTVSKATLYNLDGKVIATSSRKTNTNYPKPGHSERDLQELWKNNVENIREILTISNINRNQILGICNVGHGNGLYLLDRYGKGLKGIQSLDIRAESICKEWIKNGISDNVFPYTLQKCWASQSNSLLAWLKKNEPKLYNSIGTIFLCKDYLNYCLTGEIASDYTDMGATNLMDIRKRAYSEEALRYFEIDEVKSKLPQLKNSTDIVGRISKSASVETGLAQGTPVITGMLDVDSSMIGAGVIKPNELCIVSGTWSINALVTDTIDKELKVGMTSFFGINKYYKILEASATSVTNLEWFVNQFCDIERQEAKDYGKSVFEICDKKVVGILKSPTSIIFHPFLHGTDINAKAKANFFGISGSHSRIDMLKAVYQGIIFAHKNHIDLLLNSKQNISKAKFTGGGSKSPVLCQLMSNVLNLTLEVPIKQETGTWGAAMTAGVGAGAYKSYEECMRVPKSVKVYVPDQERSGEYVKAFQEYKNLAQALNYYR